MKKKERKKEEGKGREEEKKRADEERKRREEAERGKEEEKKKREISEREKRELEERIERMNVEMEELKKKEGEMHSSPPTHTPSTIPSASHVITSLDETSVVFPQSDGIQREGNSISHHGSNYSIRNCFVGGVMTSV